MKSIKSLNKSELSEFGDLFDRVRNICESKRNLNNLGFWSHNTRAHWRGTAPKKRTEIPFAPFVVELEPPLWGLILDFNVKEYFTDPKTYLKAELKKKVFRFENFNDSSYIGKSIPIWLGVPFETTFFGLEPGYSDHDSPWISKIPAIKNESDLDNLPAVDFYKSGLMPLAHRFYSEIKDIMPDDFEVIFPEWEKSIFSVLWHIRGLENILLDMYDKPDFVHSLFKRITAERKNWFTDWAKFFNKKIGPGNLLNDEVGSPVISPRIYEEFILSSEIELAEFHGGISYWHSCGNTTDFIKLIRKIPGLALFHVSGRTNLKTAVEEMGKNGIAIQVNLDPQHDFHNATKIDIEKKLKEIVETCGDVAYYIIMDGIQRLHTVDFEIEKIKEWIEVAKVML
ncbi:MAG: hypothetical protein M1308_17590 [Actinobacteria bacterium]|nr:hypothetical protein [Actinomycetota bacterium]